MDLVILARSVGFDTSDGLVGDAADGAGAVFAADGQLGLGHLDW
ncbi:hypothetical protein Dfulv_37610 [Dactylosporangium fulvum]|uniref:Uncharacterized protein n=1 Tax=Dactylosporangium fulvum TaxID=53359 RepID=A0ABY5VUK6_9ACTN|nr:hypothetical protein [Dactylosporangium fulvum]UWP80814.1 hypothetical protein Dfulv_37610 [Dactylosporangium fulvum]